MLKQHIYHTTTADIAGVLVTTNPAAIREISGQNNSLVDVYLQIFDRDTIPVDGVTGAVMMLAPVKVEAGKRFDLKFPMEDFPNGLAAQTGLYICASSTKYTKTIAVAPTLDLTVIYDSTR